MDLSYSLLHSMLYNTSTTNRKPTASPQQVVRQTASLTASWTTCRTASPQQIHNKLHATMSKSYSKSHNLLYDTSTANRSNGVRHYVSGVFAVGAACRGSCRAHENYWRNWELESHRFVSEMHARCCHCIGYCTAGVDKRAYTTADSAVSYLNHARIA